VPSLVQDGAAKVYTVLTVDTLLTVDTVLTVDTLLTDDTDNPNVVHFIIYIDYYFTSVIIQHIVFP